jgi:hypothetical protein
MTTARWQTSEDPQAMIRWIAGRGGGGDGLWEFTIACLLRVYDDLPGEEFRRVVGHFRQVGAPGVDDLLGEAAQVLGKLERRARRCDDDVGLARLDRQVGLGATVFALEFQAPEEAAADVSRRLLEWAEQPGAERRSQAETLRRLFREVAD